MSPREVRRQCREDVSEHAAGEASMREANLINLLPDLIRKTLICMSTPQLVLLNVSIATSLDTYLKIAVLLM